MYRIVVARMVGGLGNQLFIYAAARRLSLKNNAELVLDTISGFASDHEYQRSFQLDNFAINYRKATSSERFEPFSKIRRYLMSFMLKLKKNNKNFFTNWQNSKDLSILTAKFSGTAYVEGYWQDNIYFKDCEDIIRKDLKIKPPIDEMNLCMAKSIESHLSIALHVRFFFDQDSGKNISITYYNAAIKKMEQKFKNAHYYLFSDKPDEVEQKIKLPSDRFTLVNHNLGDNKAYLDLWLMSLCNHFIIANSTFSWWGAWLSSRADKTVIAPDKDIHGGGEPAEMFDQLILDEWEKL